MLPCNGCAYRRDIPGDCHNRCAFDWRASGLDRPRNQTGGHTVRWFNFPHNFDPVWGPDECPARSDKSDAERIAKHDPLVELIALMFSGR